MQQLFDFLNLPILALPLAIILLLLIIAIPLIVIYLFLRLTEAAFEQVGFDHWHATLAVFGSILGSLIDVPLHSGTISSYPGWYVTLASIFIQGFPTTFHPFYLDINVGGAIIPLAISAHLVFARRVSALKAGAGVLVVAIVTYILAAPVPNEGIVLPFWVSPTLAAICGLVLSLGYDGAPSLAYISGSMGTLLGADILNLLTPGVLPALSPLGLKASRPLILSIGGAGVFDGIFLTGILAVLFAAGIVCLFHGSCDGVKMHRDVQKAKKGS
ncbi:MAG: DUF1614 domain-containing protein [Methanotrichaceae archaeon]